MTLAERCVWLLALAATVSASIGDDCSSCSDCLDACAASRDRFASEHALLQRRFAVSELRDQLREVDETTAGKAGPLALLRSAFQPSPLAPRMDTYVINLDTRRDRCACMELQLADAPQAVHRQASVKEHECSHLKDDVKTLYGKRNHTREKSLFCTNYKIWQNALSDKADFVVVMEDDVILSSKFWSTLMDFVTKCPNFDYVSVDSWKGGGDYAPEVSDVCAPGGITSLFRPSPSGKKDYWGTQVQLIRGSFLPTLIERAEQHGMGPLDVWWQMNVNDGRSFSWRPMIAPQAFDRTDRLSTMGCSVNIINSDIETASNKQPLKLLQTLPRLQCP